MVRGQQGHIPPCGGQAGHLRVQLLGRQLLAVQPHRHQPVLRTGTVMTQQQRGIAVGADADAAQVIAAIIIGRRHITAGVEEAQLLLRNSAEASAGSGQIVDHAAPQGAARGLLITVDAVKHHIAGEHTVLLPHRHRGQRLAVGRQCGGHDEPVRGQEGEHRLPRLVIDPDGSLAAALAADHGKPALLIQGGGQDLPGTVKPIDQPLARQDIQRRTAHIIGHGTAAAGIQSRRLELHCLVVDALVLFVQHRHLVHGHDGQTAIQGGKAARLVAGIAVQLGAAVFILLRLGVDDAAAQSVEAAAVQQHRRRHSAHRQQRHHR